MKLNDEDFLLLFLLIAVALLGAVTLLPGCTSIGPASWSPGWHVEAMQACQVSCRPGYMKSYGSIDGTCTCTQEGDKDEVKR